MIKKEFQEKYLGKDVYKYVITGGIIAEISEFGATVLSLNVPDENGRLADVALGSKNVKGMLGKTQYLGATIGRCCNRIAGGRFTLGGKEYRLYPNDNGVNSLHGGKFGFNARLFASATEEKPGESSVTFSYVSPDGEEGYPAELDFSVKYTVKGKSLIIEYFATSDGDTPFSPTNHTFFNLNGEQDGTILDNVLKINAANFLPINEKLVPTGEIRSVKNTPFDFTEYKEIGKDINAKDEQLAFAGGYDHNFCVDGSGFRSVALAYSRKTGIVMECLSDRAGVQFYSGNFLDGKKGKSVYPFRSGFCLETQSYPDAIHHSEWGNPVLKKGERFYSRSEYRFSVLKTKPDFRTEFLKTHI